MTAPAEVILAEELDLYLGRYRSMVLIRRFEELIQSLFLRGEIYRTTHLYIGQVGFDTYNLGPGDSVSFDGSLPYRLWAIGDEPAEAIWAVVGRHGVVTPT